MLKKKYKKEKSLKDLLLAKRGIDTEKQKYINHEFQVFGLLLAKELDASPSKISLLIKMAQREDRALLQTALEFVKGAHKPKSKMGLFLWKCKQLRATGKFEPPKKIVSKKKKAKKEALEKKKKKEVIKK